MNYGEVKTQFRSILNRRDVTPSDIEFYVSSAIQRAQRLLRVTAAEETHTIPVVGGETRFNIPGDYLKLISIRVDDEELTRTNLTNVLRFAQSSGYPKFFARDGVDIVIGPEPQAESVITIQYLADFSSLTSDTDTNWLTEIAPDVIINGAMSAACRKYVDPRGQSYEDEFVKGIADLNLQSSEDELTNAQITPAYALDFDIP